MKTGIIITTIIILIIILGIIIPTLIGLINCKLKYSNNNAKVLKSQSGEKLLYIDETLYHKHTGPHIDLFETILNKNFISQPHIDMTMDQFFIVTKGNYKIISGSKNIKTEYATIGDIIFIPKGVPFQIINTDNQAGKLIGIFTPSGRFQLLREMDNLKRKGLLSKSIIKDLEKKYCTFQADLPQFIFHQPSEE